MLSALLVVLVAGFFSAASQADTFKIKVTFDGNCPKSVDKDLAELKHGSDKTITWTAYKMDGSVAEDMEFKIFFDPFKGKFKKAKDGVVTSPKVDSSTPKNSKKQGGVLMGYVEFKYTIVGTDCVNAAGENIALDPRIRVS